MNVRALDKSEEIETRVKMEMRIMESFSYDPGSDLEVAWFQAFHLRTEALLAEWREEFKA